MDIFGEARALYRSGNFTTALGRLEVLKGTRLDIDTSLLKASLCEATGDASEPYRESRSACLLTQATPAC